MSALEMQRLMEEVSRKERELDELTRPPPPPRGPSALAVSVSILAVVAGVVGLVYGLRAQSLDGRRTPDSLRATVEHAHAIPWRHYVGRQANRGRCDVWLSVLGMAEVECAGNTVYRGFGTVDHDGSFRSVEVSDRKARDPAREAVIDVRARRGHIGAFAVDGRLASGMIDLYDLEDESLAETPPPPLPPSLPAKDMHAAIERALRSHNGELAECADDNGKLRLSVRVRASGAVTEATVSESTVSAAVGRCVVRAARRWKFPASDDGWGAEFPIVFAD